MTTPASKAEPSVIPSEDTNIIVPEVTQPDVRDRASMVIDSVNHQLDAIEKSVPVEQITMMGAKLPGVFGLLFKVIDSADPELAAQRVAQVRRLHPDLDRAALAKKIIRDKAFKTGAIGAATTAVGTAPGAGTIAAVTLGVTADVVATFKLQVELVMELAELNGYKMTRAERRTAVLTITGLGAGLDTAMKAIGSKAMVRIGREYGERALFKALPFVGILLSAGANVLATEVVGNRAQAYFSGEDVIPFTEQIVHVTEVQAANAQRWWQGSERTAKDWASQIGPTMETARVWTWERASDVLPAAGAAVALTGEGVKDAVGKAGQAVGSAGEGVKATVRNPGEAVGQAGESVKSAVISASAVFSASYGGG
jgi:uncharacterized protein (DUF697 family)